MRKIIKTLLLLFYIFVMISCSKKRKMDTIELSDGSFIECQSLSSSEFAELRSRASEGPINEYKIKFNAEVYKLEGQEVIVSENDYYMLLNNISDVAKLLSDAAQSPQGAEILSNKNPYGKNFPAHTKELVKELTDTLGIAYNESNEQLLREIDRKLNRLPDASKFKKTHLLNFIAIIGEVLTEKHNTSWEMILSSDGKTWNPYLKSDNRPIEFFTYLYEDIYINNESEALLMEVYETINDILRQKNV